MQQTINCKGRLLSLEQPIIMGVLNVTEDSFFDGGCYFNDESIYLKRVESMLSEQADIIDIGVMSTRYDSLGFSEEEECKRIKKVVSNVVKHFPEAIISVDTWRANVAKLAVDLGACMINDISGGQFDNQMFSEIATLKVPYVLMHTSGKPEVMQQKTTYQNVVKDVFYFLSQRLQTLYAMNVSDVIIDVGFGFGKTIEQNYELLHNIELFKMLDCPVMVALSRKSMFWKFLETSPEEALNATTTAHTYALLHHANILRVHDIKAAKECIRIVKKIQESSLKV